MPIGEDTHAWRRDLPHLEKSGKTHFLTFCTESRHKLTPPERTIVCDVILERRRIDYWLHCFVVMPDHVHAVLSLA